MKTLKDILKNKIVLTLSVVVLSGIIIFLIACSIVSSLIKINGNSRVYINYNETYKEKGATLKIFNKDLSNYIKIKSNVKNGKIGSYKVTYNVEWFFLNLKKVRIVNIVDRLSPKIVLKGENKVSICPSKEYEEEGYEAIDDFDGDLTDKVIINKDKDNITYEVSDKSGNKEKVIREILKEDEEAPKLTLKGSLTTYIRNGTNYHEYGYIVSDNCDDNVDVEVKGNVDTTNDGEYILTYIATDSIGNKTTLERKIVVYTDNRVGIVYLTFDDGPSDTGSTEKILNVLKEENVKATFFVTGSGSDYLIRREYEEGHTVALHTNVHNYATVYSSVDNYYNDLNAISNRVYNITGIRSKIIRFPGGSNNTVSNRYMNGIMDILTKDVMDKGYIYFDWNVSSGDAGQCYDSNCVYNNVINGLSKNRINIVLMHDIKMFTANALRDIILYCKYNGYIFEVIDESTYQVKFK